MKKRILLGALVLALGVGSLVVYADTGKGSNILPIKSDYNYNEEYRQDWIKERIDFKKERMKEALEKGTITEEEAKTWEEHFTYMDEFHEKNGYMHGGCGGRGMKFGGGMGMMGGHRR